VDNKVINKILFVCIGNICRSPMAEGMFQQTMPGKAVFSAGLCAMEGDSADSFALQLMREIGVDISAHRAKNLAGWMVSEADLIVTMDLDQKRYIEHRYAAAAGKVVRLGEAGRFDIPDPYQQGPVVFRHAYNLIAEGVDSLVERIAQIDGPHGGYVLAPARESPLPLAP
jgi:protein-tyrosine phosphatase